MSIRQSPSWYGKSLVSRIYSFKRSGESGNIFLSIAGMATQTISTIVQKEVRRMTHLSPTKKVTQNHIIANTAWSSILQSRL